MTALQIIGCIVGVILLFNVYVVIVALMVYRVKTKREREARSRAARRIRTMPPHRSRGVS